MRKEFSRKTKLEAWVRAQGRCECCGIKLDGKRVEYDHIIADGLGGEPVVGNCRVLCSPCHLEKTRADAPRIAKTNRIRAREAGIRKKSRFSCSRDSRFKKRIDGSVVLR
jgi:5-methylcytosine-specific restriction endonuclease McrA